MEIGNYTISEIIQGMFSRQSWILVGPALLETLYMLLISSIFVFFIGFLIGIIMYMTNTEGLAPNHTIYNILSSIVDALRSIPSMILIILVLPIARLLTGKGYGMGASIVALAISLIPMYGRLVENSLLEIGTGKIEAARSLGLGNRKILFKIVIPETITTIIRNFIVVLIAIISVTAIAGNFGAGGLGYIAVQYGFNRFQTDIMILTVILLILIALACQAIGTFIVRSIQKKRHIKI